MTTAQQSQHNAHHAYQIVKEYSMLRQINALVSKANMIMELISAQVLRLLTFYCILSTIFFNTIINLTYILNINI